MDLWPTYLHLGGEPPPLIRSTSWTYPGSFKELPLVGQLSLQQVDNVYPFLPLIQFKDHPICTHDSQDHAMTSVDDDTSAARHAIELPLLSGSDQHHCHQDHDHPHHHHHPHHAHLIMDGCIWPGLPHELIERVVAFLHVPDIIRLCSVSKLWNSITSSPNFLTTFEETYVGRYSALMFQCNSTLKQKLQTPWLALYDTVDNKWYSSYASPHCIHLVLSSFFFSMKKILHWY